MAQAIFAPMHAHISHSHSHSRTDRVSIPMPLMTPSSPDPTPLRMLAFSVAEAALQSNPNSPMFHQLATKIPTPPKVKVVDPASEWPVMGGEEMLSDAQPMKGALQQQELNRGQQRWASPEGGAKKTVGTPSGSGTIAQRRNRELWNVIDRAKERKQSSIEDPLPFPPPLSPSYNFTLPPNSPLAESIAAEHKSTTGTPSRRPDRRAMLASLGRVSVHPSQLYTRSAEPSPTQSTFKGLDQTRPPPEFKPRLTAEEFNAKSGRIADATKAKHARTQSDADSPDLASPTDAIFPVPVAKHMSRSDVHRVHRTPQRLPSLQQIQAKMSRVSSPSPSSSRQALVHRRSGSEESLPTPAALAAAATRGSTSRQSPLQALQALHIRDRPATARKDSEDSVQSDIIQTPPDEVANPLRDRRLALQVIMNRRPPTPPSPSKERLLPFLRERTSDRLAGVKGVEFPRAPAQTNATVQTPPPALHHPKPVLRVTPPSLETRPAVPPLNIIGENNGTPSPTTSFMLTRLARRRQSSTPTDLRFTPPARLSTPPLRAISHTYGSYGPYSRPTTPVSPTTSVKSFRSLSGSPFGASGSAAGTPRSTGTGAGHSVVNSPTLSIENMPIITCTPAVDESSDDGQSEPDVVVFDAVAEAEGERMERERRGNAMRAKLGLRRRSID